LSGWNDLEILSVILGKASQLFNLRQISPVLTVESRHSSQYSQSTVRDHYFSAVNANLKRVVTHFIISRLSTNTGSRLVVLIEIGNLVVTGEPLFCSITYVSGVLNNTSINFSHLKNPSGKNTDGISFKLRLKEFLPEWLPIQGKRIRLYHHGMKRQCNGCFGIGHSKWACKETKINWRGYVDRMVESGRFKTAMFGSWIKENMPEPEVEDEDLRALITNPEKLKKMVALFDAMKKSTPSQNASQTQPKRGRPNGKANQGGSQKNQRFTIRGNQGGNSSQGKPNPDAKKPPAKKKKE